MNNIRRIFLFPFSVLYDLITRIRNWLFDAGVLHSTSFSVPVICVGNLSTGGTGKTPAVEYIAGLLLGKGYNVAILSRGYGRKTKGFRFVDGASLPAEAGDEPCQYARKFSKVAVAVCENRPEGVRRLLEARPRPDVILLDDAFQHRRIRAGLNILVTRFDLPFFSDLLLPAGSLRESASGARRADLVIVSKSPQEMDSGEKNYRFENIRKRGVENVFFSFLEYSDPRHLFNDKILNINNISQKYNILAVTGIANPEPLTGYLTSRSSGFAHLRFSDHYDYTTADLKKIKDYFINFANGNKLILTTEKDATRIISAGGADLLKDLPVYYIPVLFKFHAEESKRIEQIILNYVTENQTIG